MKETQKSSDQSEQDINVIQANRLQKAHASREQVACDIEVVARVLSRTLELSGYEVRENQVVVTVQGEWFHVDVHLEITR